LAQPPKWALRQIQAGRLKGKTDINPQWRYQAMTEQFGLCGIGWKYEIVRLWQEPGPDAQVFAFAEIKLYLRQGEQWSDSIPGIGGHMLIPKEKSGLHANDEAYKMAVTDALSTAMKMIGVAADIYSGAWDGSKYRDNEQPKQSVPQTPSGPKLATRAQADKIIELGKNNDDVVMTENEIKEMIIWYRKGDKLTYDEAEDLINNFQERQIQYIKSFNFDQQDAAQ
jgi:hypothetical protein